MDPADTARIEKEKEEREVQLGLLQRGMEQVGFFKSKKILVHTPGELEYERSVANANLLYRFARPACVAQPEHESHVRIIVQQAKDKGIPIRIKNGGHSYAGFSTINNGILIDLVNMKKVDLDMKQETITMEGGALWAHAYHELINDHHDGYVINGGRCPSVGVSGFTLGGGLGPFTRSFGMGSDTLLEATLVTADNEHDIITVKASDPKDSKEGKLFWALCGAGGGNFGVLVKLKMKLQKLHSDLVVAGRYLWSPTDQKDFTDSMIRFYTTKWSNEMTIDSSWLCDLKDKREDPQVRFLVYYNGREKAFDAEIDKHLGDLGTGERKGELANQLKRRTLEEKSTRFLHETLVSQWSEETQKALPSNAMFRIYTSFIFQNEEGQITEITSILKEKMAAFKKRFEGEEGLLQVTWIHSGGKANEKDTGESAYPWRKCIYHTYIMIEWKEKWLELDMRDALQELNLALRKYSTNGLGVFINFPDEALKKEAYEEAYYGENHRELQQVKAKWDKGNVFEWSQGVRVGPHVGGNVAARSAAPRVAQYTTFHQFSDECEDTAAHEEFLKPKALTDRAPREQWDSYSPILMSGLVGPAYALASLVS